MTNEERLEKMFEEIRSKVSEGWHVESLSVNRFTLDSGSKSVYIELEIVQK